MTCDQLKQALLNLTLNARDAMPRGGDLRIGSSIVDIESGGKEGRPPRRVWPGTMRLLVTDTAARAMDKTTLMARTPEPFRHPRNHWVRNRSLGLSVAHSIITQSGGYISVEGEIGRGTRFEILLPCVGTVKKAATAAGSERRPGRLRLHRSAGGG